MAHVLHFSLAELLEMEWYDLAYVWFPIAKKIFVQSGAEQHKLMRSVFDGLIK